MREPTLLEKISFGLGDFSSNGIFTFVSTYLMYYYTDSAGLSLGAICTILLIGRVVDAFSSPLMGIAVDRTNTRWGKCRPFLAIGILPVVIIMVMLFSLPENLSDTGKVILAIALYIVFSILFAFMNVPYSTMLTVLTDKNEQRISFNLFKNLGANPGGLFVTASAFSVIALFSAEEQNGFIIAAILFGIIFLIGTLMCVINVRERVRVSGNQTAGVKQSLTAVFHNKPWIILCGVQFLSLTYMMIRNQGTIYYAKYYLHTQMISSLLLAMMPVASVLTAFILPAIVKKRRMKFCVLLGNLLWSAAMIGTWLVGTRIWAVIVFHAIASIGWGLATGMIFVMLSQTIDYGRWKTGLQPQGMFTSLIAFVQKLGVACAGVVCSQVLNMGRYIANQEAGESSLLAIRLLFCGLPLVLSVFVMILISAYRLDEIYPQVEAGLRKREQEQKYNATI